MEHLLVKTMQFSIQEWFPGLKIHTFWVISFPCSYSYYFRIITITIKLLAYVGIHACTLNPYYTKLTQCVYSAASPKIHNCVNKCNFQGLVDMLPY